MADDRLFLIFEGVRRSVAVREAGGTIIPAFEVIGGFAGPVFFVRLAQLYSRKDRVPRIDPQLRYLKMEILASTPLGRSQMDAIQVDLVSPALAKLFTPLMDVVLVP